MEGDKSPSDSLATSTFSRASTYSCCTTKDSASKTLDFDIVPELLVFLRKGLPKKGVAKKSPFRIMDASSSSANCLSSDLDQVIQKHTYNFGFNKRIGAPITPPLIPLCRLMNMEYMRILQRNSETVEKLQQLFIIKGYTQQVGAKFYVLPTEKHGKHHFVEADKRNGWDNLWKEQDRIFEEEIAKKKAFHSMKNQKFPVLMEIINYFCGCELQKKNPTSLKYHPRVDCVIFKGDESLMVVLQDAMHGVNRYDFSQIQFFQYVLLHLLDCFKLVSGKRCVS
jgi:hypothetical protein